MTRRLTVATGPPGTGKSQLVVNAVVTAVAAHQSVLVASTNNPAVDEVHRRCMEIAPSLLIRTGNKKNQEKEREQLQTILNADDRPPPSLETREFDLDAADDDLSRVNGLLTRHAERERALLDTGQVRADLERTLGCTAAALDQRLGRGWGARSSRLAGAWLFGGFRRRRWLARAESPADDEQQRCRELADLATATEQWKRLRGQAAPADEQLRSDSTTVRVAHQERCLAYIQDVALNQQQKGRSAIEQLERGDGSWDLRAATLPYLGGWALTSLSARRFKTTKQFDLVIIDEAGQCSIGTILPLLHRAKRALIIGDGMQLPHICNVDAGTDRQLRSKHNVGAQWLFQNKMSPRRHSAFDAAAHAAGKTLLLNEHYRCAPAIAALSNRQFYGSALTILTDVRAHGRAPATSRPIRWHNVRGGPERGPRDQSWQNADEIAAVVGVVRALWPGGSTAASIGVVTPYRAQADAIRSALGDVAEPEHGPSDERLVRVGTAHRFQGGERDQMVLSLVAAHDGGDPKRFDFVEQQRRLWNVAITRARSTLIVVGDREFWRGRGGVGAELVAACETDTSVGASPSRELLRRLHWSLVRQQQTVEMGATRDGYRVDAVVTTPDGEHAYLLDPAAEPNADPGEHLQVMLRRTELLGDDATRLPAWKLLEF